jgi:hypothetical protein
MLLRFNPVGTVSGTAQSYEQTIPVTSEANPQYPGLQVLRIGEYTVSAASPAGVTNLPAGYTIKSITADGVDLLTHSLKIDPAEAPRIDVTLGVASPAPWVKLSGRVTGLTASAVRPDTVTIASDRLAGPLVASIAADGSFEFQMVLPATYRATLTPAADPFFRTIGVVDTMYVEIPAVLPALKVSGKVADMTSFAQSNTNQRLVVSLRSEPLGGGGFRANSDVTADGSFDFAQVPPGTYRVAIGACQGGDVCPMTDSGSVVVTEKNIENLAVAAPRRRLPAR